MRPPSRDRPRPDHRVVTASWVLALALVAALIGAVVHRAEEAAFLRTVERAAPWWLAVAVLLQSLTYVAQAASWRRIGGAAGLCLSRREAVELSLAKLFVDQTLPSVGLSGSALVTQAFEGRGGGAAAVRSAVLVNLVSFHLAFDSALVVATAILGFQGRVHPALGVALAAFLGVSLSLILTIFRRAGRGDATDHPAAARVRPLRALLAFVDGADRRVLTAPGLVRVAVAWQGVLILLDAATLWVLVAAFGTVAAPFGVFAAFLVASLMRTMGGVPGGLGTFEAACVVMLRVLGVDLAVALAATLVFRGLSFWIPMLPGYVASRRFVGPRVAPVDEARAAYWSPALPTLLHTLGSSSDGLSAATAATRLVAHGPNVLAGERGATRREVLLRQVRNPILWLLLFAAGASAATGQWIDAAVVAAIVLATVGIGYTREYRAETAVAVLRERVGTRARVLRDTRPVEVDAAGLVPGDVILLTAGALVPADARLLEATDCFVNEAVLTGESFPVPKEVGLVPRESMELRARTNCVLCGTNVRSGSARAVVVATGSATELGRVASRLGTGRGSAEFERGVRRFGYLLTGAMLCIAFAVFGAHMLRGRPAAETLLFAVALALGLSPELLPAILTINLARGAHVLAQRGVLVRRLDAIEDLGSMDVLCTDKTGTLTRGEVTLEGAYDPDGVASSVVLRDAVWNAALETGVASPLDEAIVRGAAMGTPPEKLAEVPFDFVRRRVSVVVAEADGVRLITKGAFDAVLAVCATVGDVPITDERRAALTTRYATWAAQGTRVLAVATRRMPAQVRYTREDERALRFVGFLTFLDEPKAGVRDAVDALAARGVAVRMITGDSRLVAAHVARVVGLPSDRVLTGATIATLDEVGLRAAVASADLYAEVDPAQKERIVVALRREGHVVGFLGDGVNDAPALRAADAGLSVEGAVDVARQAADFVLLERGLDVIRRGVDEGRRTFANTLKYVQITTSANLGNMVSMAAVSLTLPFLPLTAGQILLNNFLSDVPAIGIADDDVDPERLAAPERWEIGSVARYMVTFGAISSVFDVLTFWVLRRGFAAGPELFRTGWFVESLLTELAVALVARTRRPFYRSRPGRLLLWSTLSLIPVAFAIPYLPTAGLLGFVPLPVGLSLAIAGVTVAYVATTEVAKRGYFRPHPANAVAATAPIAPSISGPSGGRDQR